MTEPTARDVERAREIAKRMDDLFNKTLNPYHGEDAEEWITHALASRYAEGVAEGQRNLDSIAADIAMGREIHPPRSRASDDQRVTIRGRVQMIAGRLHVVGVPDSWPYGVDDWEIRQGDVIELTVPVERLTQR